ncbi:hypothetical protein CAPTEDRAFT_190948 [Capitella teleta]|uniref:Fibronectin type-III domain-containing protein n=1 Tax=Capitella teleta TaxID=283909 RepID=R7V8C6_CAPTE|nr:hypothetical protein CAPTEDRAFT_190948 [Capitella teleta]|eukprot:ELU12606.1 hypothetical protein CAPTEDRAFT_190948 [Capitella teleta]
MYLALMVYRATPITATGFSPSEIMIGRKLRTTIPALPKTLKSGMAPSQKILEENDAKAKRQTHVTSASHFVCNTQISSLLAQVSLLYDFVQLNSAKLCKEKKSVPLPPLGLTIDIAETTESSLLILWEDDETRSYITSWDVEIADIGTYRPKAVGSTSDRTVLNYEITNLISGKNYTAYVFGKSGDQRSHQAATVDLTLKPVINSVLSEDTDQTKENVIVLTYNQSNVGEFDHYLFSLNGSSDTVTVAKQHRHLYPRITFTNLVAGVNYVVTARTISGIEESTPIQKSIVTKPFAPNWACDQGADRLTIILSKPLGFVDEYILECQEGCNVVEFSLLVTTDRGDSRNRAANQPSWKDSKDKLPMPPYFAVNRCSDLFDGDNMCWSTSRKKRNVVERGTRVHFTVGGALNCDIRDDSFCNGPLQSDSTYHVAIVGYTENGLHTVGPISDPIRTGRAGTTAEDPNQPKSVNIVTIAVGVGLGILLLISVLTSLAIFHCRKRVARPDTRPQEDMAVSSDPTYTNADQVALSVESGPLNADDLPRQPTSVTSPDTGYEALDVENSNNQKDDYEVLEGIYHEIPDATDKA